MFGLEATLKRLAAVRSAGSDRLFQCDSCIHFEALMGRQNCQLVICWPLFHIFPVFILG